MLASPPLVLAGACLAVRARTVATQKPARFGRRWRLVLRQCPSDVVQLPPQDQRECPFGFSSAQRQPSRNVSPVLVAAVAVALALVATAVAIIIGVPLEPSLAFVVVFLFVGKAIWEQYSPSFLYNLPPADMGPPLIGYTRERVSGGPSDEKGFFRTLRQRLGPAFTTNFGLQSVVVIDYSVYEEYMLKLERAGKLVPVFPDALTKLVGRNSVMVMPSGAQHRNVRRRLQAALSTKQVVSRLSEIEMCCRSALEAMVDETSNKGQTALCPHVDRFTLEVALAFIVGKLEHDELEKLLVLLPDVLAGVSCFPPWELWGLSPYGKAMNARQQACDMIDTLLEKAKVSSKGREANVLRALSLPSADGDALTAEEIRDTVLTVSLAGTLTTGLAIPSIVVQLSNRPEWITRCAAPLDDFATGIEDASRPVLQFLREALRYKVPVSGFRRSQISEWTSIGKHDVPPGMPITTSVDALGCPLLGLIDRSAEFDPGRWADPSFATRNFIFFGGKQPHACAGKSVALVEMQIFAQMLCQDYEFQVLSQTTAPDRFLNLSYKDGLPMRVWRKGSKDVA